MDACWLMQSSSVYPGNENEMQSFVGGEMLYILFVSTRSSNGLTHLLLFGDNGKISSYSSFVIIAFYECVVI